MESLPGNGILDVMMPTFRGDKNEYGKDAVPAIPLTFDRVNEGRPPQTNARLFQLPFEILGVILEYIPSDSLAALALVNSDCLQLARSRQFVSIVLDYSDSSLALIEKLRSEIIAHPKRTTEPEARPMPLLGVCIRRITVATHPGWVHQRHDLNLSDEEFALLAEGEWNRRIINATRAFFDGYIRSVAAVFNQWSTPNLELLDWEDMVALPQPLFTTIAVSSIRHLKLFRVKADRRFAIEPSGIPHPFAWPLQTLHLEFSGEIDTSMLSASILRLCASSLERLFLSSMSHGDPYTFIGKDHACLPEFPRLRHLGFGSIHFADASMPEALITDSIRSLGVSLKLYPGFFKSRGLIPSLEAFAWDCILTTDDSLHCLRANPQLLRLAFPSALANCLIETQILPLLSESFSRLESLSLVWEENEIPESAVEVIGTLKTLKQLHLSAGCQFGWRHDWPIKHGVMRKHLSNLLQLEKLAFSRDSYVTKYSRHRLNTYYEDRLPVFAYDSDETEHNQRVWEVQHQKRMRNEANQYIRVMFRLEWLYFGQIPMKVSRSGKNHSKRAVPLHPERDSCWTLLRKIFGGHTDS